MKKNLRILNLIDIPWHSALAAYAFDQSLALTRRGHQIFFAAPAKTAAAEFATKNNFPLVFIPERKSYNLAAAFWRLRRFIKTERIDILNAHTGKTHTLAWLLSLTMPGLTVIRTKSDAKKPSKSIALSKTAAIITGSQIIRQMYLSLGIAADKIHVVYQGITPIPEKTRPENSTLKIGILGRLDPVKGHSDFIKAAALVLHRFKNVEFLIAGRQENVQYAQLSAQAEALGITDKLKYLGHVPDASDFIDFCDIGVIASLGSEMVSRAALEWMSAAKPVIATNVGSLPEFIENNWLVQPGNSSELAEKLLILLNSGEKRLQTGTTNKNRLIKDFNPLAFDNNTELVLQSAINYCR